MEPDELLFTEKDGTRTQLQDVIYDGLDHDYSERYPALLRLMQEGQPAHRLYACLMLASWGVPEGIQTLIQWARNPDATPWADQPFTFDRFYGVDSSFEMMADAIQVAQEIDRNDKIDTLRADAVRALLGIYHRVHFGRALMVVLDLDDDLKASVKVEVGQAVDRAIATAQTSKMPFDLATQAAFLLSPLASLDDAHAARAADALLSADATTNRTTREVAHSLGWGAGPVTHAILERLVLSPSASIRKDAQDSLSRRATTTRHEDAGPHSNHIDEDNSR
ncbi:MAG: hypothetical protein ABIO92_03835 [Chloroflexia bacterium]